MDFKSLNLGLKIFLISIRAYLKQKVAVSNHSLLSQLRQVIKETWVNIFLQHTSKSFVSLR